MISAGTADAIVLISLLICVGTYIWVSRREGSYVNILTPSTLVGVPALYLLPLLYTHLFQTEGSTFAYLYIYLTLAVQNVAFAYFYTRKANSYLRLPFHFGYASFWKWSIVCVALAALVYLPVLLQFPQYILSPRQIYLETRTGFGASSFTSSSLAYLGVLFVLFSTKSVVRKGLVIFVAVIVLSLHGSKGQVLEVLFYILLYLVYVKRKRFKLVPTLIGASCVSVVIVVMFAASMFLGESPMEAVQAISEYSDYTRNDLLVIDSHMPPQYGRLTLESNFISLIPRALVPNKPKNFGAFFLAEEFFPKKFDADQGAPAFAIGVQYADFGWLAIVYLAIFSAFRGWLSRVCVNRLQVTHHPGDLILVAFMAEVTLFPIGGGGWFLPETLFIAILVRFFSCFGATKIYKERIATKLPGISPHVLLPMKKAGETC